MEQLKHTWILGMLAILAMAGACTKTQKHAYHVQGDTVHVNNEYCAVSGTKLKKEDMGRWTSTVIYQGKKLVFNQCCEMCIGQFPSLWENHTDEILQKHGLIH